MEILLVMIYDRDLHRGVQDFPHTGKSVISTAALGILGLSLLELFMNYNHPSTATARIYFR